MLALVMSVLVLVVAAVALRDGLRDGTAKPATAPRTIRSARTRPVRVRADGRPVRSGLALVASSAGIGVLLALGIGLVALLVGISLRSTVAG